MFPISIRLICIIKILENSFNSIILVFIVIAKLRNLDPKLNNLNSFIYAEIPGRQHILVISKREVNNFSIILSHKYLEYYGTCHNYI